MKPTIPVLLLGACLGLPPLTAQTCDTGKPEPVRGVTCSSRYGTATLVGFSEYGTPAAPPKKYRRQTTTGTLFIGQWSLPGCPGAEEPHDYQVAFSPGAESWSNSSGSAALIPVAVDVATNRVKYRLTKLAFTNQTEGSPWGNLLGVRVVAAPADNSMDEIGSYAGQEIWLSRDPARNPYRVFIQGFWTLAGWVGHDHTIQSLNVRGAVDLSIRDEWDETVRYSKVEGTAVTDRQSARFTGTGEFPLAAGGTASGWPVFGSVETAYGPLVSLTPQGSTARSVTGTDNCQGVAPPYQRAQGTIAQSLDEEDAEEDALARAVIVEGDGKVAFRERRKAGFSFGFSEFSFAVPLEIPCEGTYLVHFNFARSPHGSSATPEKFTRTLERKFAAGHQQLSSGRFDVSLMRLTLPEGEVMPLDYDTDYTLVDVTLERSCPASEPGADQVWRDSVHVHLSLGLGVGGRNAGQIRLDAEDIDATLYSPAALTVATPYGSGTAVIRDAMGVVRQVRAPAALADIVTLDAGAYEIRFYAAEAMGVPDPATGLYAPTGVPSVVHRFENPAPGSASRLRVTRLRAGRATVSEFAEDPDSRSWTFATGNGLRRETVEVDDLGDQRFETVTTAGADEVPVAEVWRQVCFYPWGRETVLEINDPAGVALATTSSFNANRGDSGYARLQRREFPDGSFVAYAHDEAGRPVETMRPFSGTTLNGDPLRRSVQTFAPLADADGDGLPEAIITTVDYIGDTEVGRRHLVQWSRSVDLAGEVIARRSDIRCAAPGADWNAVGNLITESLIYGPGPCSGQIRRQLNPDGTAIFTTQALDAAGRQTTVVATGAPNEKLDAIVDGTCMETVADAQGRVVAETVTDVASGLVLTAWTATATDALGRVTRMDYSDGTHVDRTYDCCGLASERDRTGGVTTFRYDDLGRQYEVLRGGMRVITGFDAVGRVVSVTRIGTDGSAIRLLANTYDLAGRLVTESDALGRMTTHAEEMQPLPGIAFVRTTLAPDGGTRIETYNHDGSLAGLAGTAVAPRTYAYGVDADGLFTRETLETAASGPQPGPVVLSLPGTAPAVGEWITTSSDFLGRPSQVRYADGASAKSYYNLRGQLERSVDPDGVTILYSYSRRGEQDTVALDLDANGRIDFDGVDHITRTDREVAVRDGVTVRREITRSWETTGRDEPVSIAINERNEADTRSWQTVRGRTTATAVTCDDRGGRTITITAPDQVQTIKAYADDRLVAESVLAPGLGVLSTQNRTYDAHGRLLTATDARNGTTSYEYFDDDRIQRVTSPDPDPDRATEGYDPQVTRYEYDECGRVRTMVQPDGGEVHTTYWPTGRVRRTWGARTYPVEYAYDSQGRLQTLTTWRDFAAEAGCAVTTWSYDPQRGWLVAKRYADGSGPDYAYYPSGRLRTRTWARSPLVTTTYRYDPAGAVEHIGYSDATPPVELHYDRAGRLQTVADAAGAVTMTCHASGALHDEHYSGGRLDGLAVSRSYDALDRLSGIDAPGVVPAVYTYDPASRLDKVSVGEDAAVYQRVPQSALIGNIACSRSGAVRLTAERTFDRLNRLTGISHQLAAGSAPAGADRTLRYNDAGECVRVDQADGGWWAYAHDPLGQLTAADQFLPAGDIFPGRNFRYEYDDIGNRRAAWHAAPETQADREDYFVNDLNQYRQRTVPGIVAIVGSAQPEAKITVRSPAVGGVVRQVRRQGEIYDLRLPVDNAQAGRYATLQVTGVKNRVGPAGEDAVAEETRSVYVPATPEVFAYDADGNLTADACWTYAWDAENRLAAMETAPAALAAGVPAQRLEFAYDYQSRRIAKQVFSGSGGKWSLTNHTLFLYDGWNLLAEYDALAGNALIRSYVWGLDLFGSVQGSGGVGGLLFECTTAANLAALFDSTGNLTAFADMATGLPAAAYQYAPFGEGLSADGPAAATNPLRFSTKYRDPETGFLYYGYRYYSPGLGRWLSRDPAAEPGGSNLYAFVCNSVLCAIDPLGKWSTSIHNQIADAAFAGTLSEKQVAVIKARSAKVDSVWRGGQDLGNSYQHAMRAPSQTVEEARELFRQFITRHLADARAAQERWRQSGKCGYSDETLDEYGYVFHAVTDSTSPSHAGFQEWNLKPVDIWYHHEGEEEIFPQEMRKAIRMAQEYFKLIAHE